MYIGSTVGAYLFTGFPSLSNRNLVKFHFTSSKPNIPSRECFKNSKIG